MTVRRPETTMDRLLMAPSVSPISIAFVVPMAWEAEPIAIPFAMGSTMRKRRQINGAKMLPSTPVTMMTATVIATMPPSSSEMPMPMAVVTDLGSSVTYCS